MHETPNFPTREDLKIWRFHDYRNLTLSEINRTTRNKGEIVILFSNFPVQFYEILQMSFTGSLFQTESLKFSHATLVHYGHHLEKENPKS